jgi:dTDP-4-dehydrorhamnose 3,5-epimerase
MIVRETELAGVHVVEPERIEDERGFFARVFDARELAELGLDTAVAETSIGFNRSRLTLRGLHFQVTPHEETKLVRCTRGAVYDVAVDLRPESATRFRWVAVELTADNRLALYLPAGCAHGYLTLEDDTEVAYQISKPYVPDAATGVRWDDPMLDIDWPARPAVISKRDAAFPDLEAT